MARPGLDAFEGLEPRFAPHINDFSRDMLQQLSSGDTLAMEETPIEARIRVRLTPRAARDEIVGWRDDVLRVRVTAPPVGGRANAALERLLASALGLPKSAVRVVSGARSREKSVVIEGVCREEALARLPAKPPASASFLPPAKRE